MSFDFVTTRLATGGAIPPTEADAQALVDAGITHVIVCNAGEDDATLFKRFFPEEVVLQNGVEDDGQPKPVSWFQVSIYFALTALDVLRVPRSKVYAHCHDGINRGPSTAYAIMLAQGWPAHVARAAIVAARPQTAVGIRYADDAEAAVKALGYV